MLKIRITAIKDGGIIVQIIRDTSILYLYNSTRVTSEGRACPYYAIQKLLNSGQPIIIIIVNKWSFDALIAG